MLNINLKHFKINHKRKKNQVIYIQQKNSNDIFIENLINNFFFVNQLNYFVYKKDKNILFYKVDFYQNTFLINDIYNNLIICFLK